MTERNHASANFIDDFIFNQMAAAGVAAAPRTTDAEFLRRVSLDLTGRIPTAEKARAFSGDRPGLIQELMQSEAFVHAAPSGRLPM